MTKSDLKDLSYVIWNLLPQDKKEEYYCNTGTLGFVETMCDLARLDINEFTCEELDELLSKLN